MIILAAVIAAGALTLAGVLVLDGSDDEATRSSPAQSGPPPSEASAAEPAVPPSERQLELPRRGYPIVAVRQGRQVEIRAEPEGKRVKTVGRETKFGSPTVFGVVRQQNGWAGVTTPYLANEKLGWVRLDPRKLRSRWTNLSIEVDLSERRVELRDGDRVMRSFSVSIGMPGSETPLGRYAVTDTFRGNLSPAYGCCALAISANQPHLPSGWLGGTRIAIHGTSGPLGEAISHGCVRAADEDVGALVDTVPLGTPVFIRS
jgi:lipoprotein-anchoring transpeptidase ErfK/SrfK